MPRFGFYMSVTDEMSEGLLEKQKLIIGLEQEEYKMGLEYVLVPENKNVLKNVFEVQRKQDHGAVGD